MFNIEDYLEKINCPCCSKDSFKILNNSNYKNIDSFEKLKEVYKSSSDNILLDQLNNFYRNIRKSLKHH